MELELPNNVIGIIQIIVFVLGGLWVLYSVRADVGMLKRDVGELKRDMKALTKSVNDAAVTESKLDDLKERYSDDRRETFDFRKWVRDELARVRPAREAA